MEKLKKQIYEMENQLSELGDKLEGLHALSLTLGREDEAAAVEAMITAKEHVPAPELAQNKRDIEATKYKISLTEKAIERLESDLKAAIYANCERKLKVQEKACQGILKRYNKAVYEIAATFEDMNAIQKENLNIELAMKKNHPTLDPVTASGHNLAWVESLDKCKRARGGVNLIDGETAKSIIVKGCTLDALGRLV